MKHLKVEFTFKDNEWAERSMYSLIKDITSRVESKYVVDMDISIDNVDQVDEDDKECEPGTQSPDGMTHTIGLAGA